MRKAALLMVPVLCFVFMGTTFVIKENGREVGRYDEEDGKTETVVLDNTLTKPKPRPVKSEIPDAEKPAVSGLEGFANEAAAALSREAKIKNDRKREEAEAAMREMEQNYPS